MRIEKEGKGYDVTFHIPNDSMKNEVKVIMENRAAFIRGVIESVSFSGLPDELRHSAIKNLTERAETLDSFADLLDSCE